MAAHPRLSHHQLLFSSRREVACREGPDSGAVDERGNKKGEGRGGGKTYLCNPVFVCLAPLVGVEAGPAEFRRL